MPLEFVPGELEVQIEFHVLEVGRVVLIRWSTIGTCDACGLYLHAPQWFHSSLHWKGYYGAHSADRGMSDLLTSAEKR